MTETAARIIVTVAIRCSTSIFIVLSLLVISISAQTTTTSATDGTTPLGITPGSPAGSYALSGFDNINAYNGNLNFRLPLLHIGGRGGAQTTIMLALNTKTWHVKHSTHTFQGQTTESYAPTDITWNGLDVGYGPGVLIGRQTGVGTWSCFSFPKLYVNTVTRLTFKTPDGTEYELRDQATNGQPLPVTSCSSTGASRGTVFVSADGTAVTFVSDYTISDNPVPPGDGSFIYPSGFLMLRDGTRYRIDAGLVSWIRDRNGNQLSFTYGTNPASNDYNRVKMITDSLGRQVTINYKVTELPPFDSIGKSDQIIFKGFGGAQRIIRVFRYNLLGTALRSDYTSTQNLEQLFPELNGTGPYNPKVVTAVYLPDGNLRYQFSYNPYGELARVVLPTGGVIEYDTRGDQPTATLSGVISPSGDSDFEIYRRVIERRVKPDGTMVEGKTVFTSSYSGFFDPTPWQTTTTIDHVAGDQVTLLARDTHYFKGSPTNSLVQNVPAYLYPAWNESKENQTEQFDSNGTTLLRRTADTFQQRIPTGQSVAILWWNSWATQNNLDAAREPANDARLTDTVTSLMDVSPNLMANQHFDYDQYNNKTDVYEYDFGSGSVGTLIRRTHTDYVTTNNGVNYATDTSIHLRDLPSEQWVSTDSGGTTKMARTTYEYDHYNQATSEDFHASLVNRSNISGLCVSFDSSGNCIASDPTVYYTRGNVTKTTRAVSFDGNGNVTGSVSGYAQYDIAGNVVKAIDPRSTTTNIIATTFDFSDRFGAPNGDARGNTIPPELGTQTSYALPTLVTNALGHTLYVQYDYYLGRPVDSEDANQIKSSGFYNDLLDRSKEIWRDVVGSVVYSKTRFVYDDTNRTITTQSDQTTVGDFALQSLIKYDGLGRTFRKATYEGNTGSSNTWAIVDTQFDALGRVKQVSNPFRDTDPVTAAAPAGIWTTTGYDGLGRVLTLTTPDLAVVTTTYLGNQTTVRDQANKQRRSTSDGVGRLTSVDEMLEYPSKVYATTTYGYDALGNLLQVDQGTQHRFFTYDSLSRLLTAKNPEQVNTSGQMVQMTYAYDEASNLLSKTGPNTGSSVSFAYDGLNRAKTKTLSSGGVWVGFHL